MEIDRIRKDAERAKQSFECAQRLEYLLGEIDKRDSEIAGLKRQHEKDQQLLEQATTPTVQQKIRAKIPAPKKPGRSVKRSGRRELKWPMIHAMREDYVVNGLSWHAISQKYGVSFDTVKAIVTNKSDKWYHKEYQDVLVERGMVNE